MEPIYRKAILHKKQYLSQQIVLDKIRISVEASRIFTNKMMLDLFNPISDLDFFDEICTRGPEAFPALLEILKSHGYEKEAEILQDTATKFSQPYFYKMNSTPLGLCLIINNEKFDETEQNRCGSLKLAARVKELFDTIGFHVLPIEQDLTAKQMELTLFEFSQNNDLDTVDSSVVFIATHGKSVNGEDALLGVDDKYILYTDIFNMFNNSICKKLLNKPKMFFFQACRGDEYGYESKMRSPFITDMIVVHSTLPGYASYQYWFVEELINVFSLNYTEHDVATMLEMVSGRVSTYGCDQVAQAVHIEQLGSVGKIHFNKREVLT